MNSPKRALLLVGSPRASQSTSESLGTYLLDKLHDDGGFVTQKVHVQSLICSPTGQNVMGALVKASDVMILAFPLYVDCLPAAVISALELIAEQRKSESSPKNQRLVAIVNNGFPEASSQNNTALAICKQFCSEAKVEWAGGLGLGGGGAISGRPLGEVGFIVRNVRKALDLAAADLLAGRAVSKQAVDLMAKTLVAKWLYLIMGNQGWKQRARASGIEDKLYSQP